ncbi:hypothetical protein HZS_6521 [Henneguya salminicola]|nr:hypothetical protein HZS_6521 [Henneguya salminicola]
MTNIQNNKPNHLIKNQERTKSNIERLNLEKETLISKVYIQRKTALNEIIELIEVTNEKIVNTHVKCMHLKEGMDRIKSANIFNANLKKIIQVEKFLSIFRNIFSIENFIDNLGIKFNEHDLYSVSTRLFNLEDALSRLPSLADLSIQILTKAVEVIEKACVIFERTIVLRLKDLQYPITFQNKSLNPELGFNKMLSWIQFNYSILCNNFLSVISDNMTKSEIGVIMNITKLEHFYSFLS